MTEGKASGGLAARIKKARATAARLNLKSDELNGELAKAQETIAGFRFGVSASVLVHVDEETAEESYLSFARFDGKWCLTLVEGRPDLSVWTTVPLLNVSRTLRMQAAEQLPALVDKLMEKTETEIAEVEKTTSNVAAFVKELREAQS